MSRLGHRVTHSVAIASTLWMAAPRLPAQDVVDTKRANRATSLAVLGTIGGALLGWGFAEGSKSSPGVFIATGAIIGGVAGFFIGGRFDREHQQQFKGLPQLTPPNISTDIEGDPSALAAADSVIAVGSSVGVELFLDAHEFIPWSRRAAGVHGIRSVALAPHTGWLAIGSGAGLYLYPPMRGPGGLVRSGDVEAVVGTPQRFFAAVDNRIEVVPTSADTVRGWPGVDLPGPARDLAVDSIRALLWAVTDSTLVSYHFTDDSLVRIGSVSLEVGARRLFSLGTRIAVAMGERGVRIFDVTDPSQPRQTATWHGGQFAYDVSLDGDRMFVAEGPEGVYVVDISGTTPRTLGIARKLGFTTTLTSHNHYTFLIDRHSNALRRFGSDF